MLTRIARTHPAYLHKAFLTSPWFNRNWGKKKEIRTNLEKAMAVKPDSQKAQTLMKQFKAAAEAGR